MMKGRLRNRAKVSGVADKSSPKVEAEELGPDTQRSSKGSEDLARQTPRTEPLISLTSAPCDGGGACTEKSSQETMPVTSTPRRPTRISRPRRVKKQEPLKKPAAKSQRGKTEKRTTPAPPPDRIRPRFELKTDESTVSSDLSVELSSYEEPVMTFEEHEACGDDDGDDDDDEELPSFLDVEQKPPPVTKGSFVWYRLRMFPSWPALVKQVNRKRKTASIMFVDKPQIHDMKGFSVPLKSLKPLECEDAAELVIKAKEGYKDLIEWTLELIKDYRIRIACGSFSGSFVDYVAHNMSLPVRRMFPQSKALGFCPEETWANGDLEDSKDSLDLDTDQHKFSRRLLPDRTLAAYNRSNERLVHYIVQKRQVEARLLAVIQGREPSRWLRSFQSSKRRQRIVNIYLEDDQQLDQVYRYLDQIYSTSVERAGHPTAKKVPFIMDVLLPEAIIHAIAGVDGVSVEKAEKKYLSGRQLSQRQREEVDVQIEEHQKTIGQKSID